MLALAFNHFCYRDSILVLITVVVYFFPAQKQTPHASSDSCTSIREDTNVCKFIRWEPLSVFGAPPGVAVGNRPY